MDAFLDISHPVDVCTFGLFIIDEIDYVHSKGSKLLIIGGAGTYVALGARLAAGAENAKSVGWIVDVGSDFPPDFRSTLESWNTRCLFRLDTSRLTTRAWNGYDENEKRAFKYLTPKVRLEAGSLPLSHLYANVFHMVCSGARCKQIVTEILERREREAAVHEGAPSHRPLFVWEPIPDLCVPSELDSFWEACRLVDVVSPNESELFGYFQGTSMTDQIKDSNVTIVEEVMRTGIGPDGAGSLIVRTGSRGCTAFTPDGNIQLRPYFIPTDHGASNERVVDPTGGGNTFLGGFCKGLVGKSKPSEHQLLSWITDDADYESELIPVRRKRRTVAALVFANVAASFAIEQQGMPRLSQFDEKELWNGEDFESRVNEYVTREKSHILGQKFL